MSNHHNEDTWEVFCQIVHFLCILLENTHLFYALFDKQMKPYLHSGRDHLMDVVLHYALGQDCCIGPLLLKLCVEKEKK